MRCVASGVNGRWLFMSDCWLEVTGAYAFSVLPAEGDSGGELGISPFNAAFGVVSSAASGGSDEISITSARNLRGPGRVFRGLVEGCRVRGGKVVWSVGSTASLGFKYPGAPYPSWSSETGTVERECSECTLPSSESFTYATLLNLPCEPPSS